VEDTSRLLDIKLKAANYEIDHLSNDFKVLSEQELTLKELNQQKDELIARLRRELQELQEKDRLTDRQLVTVCDQNKELSDTLQETNNALEGLQNELFALKAKLRPDHRSNNQLDAEEGKDPTSLPLIESRKHTSSSQSGRLDAEPDEASQSYSAEGYQNNVEKKSRETRSSQSDQSDDGIGLKGLRKRSKKKKKSGEQVDELVLPSINHQNRLGAGSVVSSIEESDCSGDEGKRKKKVSKSAPRSSGGAASARGASAAYLLSHPVVDERQGQHRRLLEQREKSGGCSQCGKKIRGDPKKLPSSLKNIMIDGGAGPGGEPSHPPPADSSPGGSSVISEAFFAGPESLFTPCLHSSSPLIS
jgi:hypothetical protein